MAASDLGAAAATPATNLPASRQSPICSSTMSPFFPECFPPSHNNDKTRGPYNTPSAAPSS